MRLEELLERPKYTLEEFASILGATVHAAGGRIVVPADSPTEYEVTVRVDTETRETVITAAPRHVHQWNVDELDERLGFESCACGEHRESDAGNAERVQRLGLTPGTMGEAARKMNEAMG